MEDFIIELDDETAAWLESEAATNQQSPSEFIAELLRETRNPAAPPEPRK